MMWRSKARQIVVDNDILQSRRLEASVADRLAVFDELDDIEVVANSWVHLRSPVEVNPLAIVVHLHKIRAY